MYEHVTLNVHKLHHYMKKESKLLKIVDVGIYFILKYIEVFKLYIQMDTY